jgi:hypothetical protein
MSSERHTHPGFFAEGQAAGHSTGDSRGRYSTGQDHVAQADVGALQGWFAEGQGSRPRDVFRGRFSTVQRARS